MIIYPAIDLIDGAVVRLHKGDFAQKTTYGTDPVAVARAYADAGAHWLHLVDSGRGKGPRQSADGRDRGYHLRIRPEGADRWRHSCATGC